MISIWKTANELVRLEELRQTTSVCYEWAIRSTSQYAIETEPAQADDFRRHLKTLHEQLQAAATPSDLQVVQSSFRGELRDYREKVGGQIDRMRKEIEAATVALQTLADSVMVNGADHEADVKRNLAQLHTASLSDDIERVRGGVRTCSASIAASVEDMRRTHQLLITQLRDEIRMLHQEIESERRTFLTDPVSGAWNRQKIDARIQDLLRLNDPFCLLLVCSRNLKRLASEHSAAVMRSVLKAMLLRFQNLIGERVMIGRWSENEFIAVLEEKPADAPAVSRDVERKLSATYTIQESGVSKNIGLQATSGAIERRVGTDQSEFYENLAQLSDTLSGA